ncbi:hypothetical protein [Jeotgalibacillus proteolyticus]|uniref:Uncharacterized protein n=1 Tax=Jeotgalibacillus proteolyticus TaxID=2082395 RepID=A0A2S5GHM1_9BACL|nr:hypothetical protein [Jeotgalibacillus proteolyticus]PPA72424.1 hypothetical protein C4B60_03345 [Jeotgalibacillus proteolyticus]
MKDSSFLPDSCNEGRDRACIDIDRIINEGLAGGTVHRFHHSANIEEARDLEQETPPNGS